VVMKAGSFVPVEQGPHQWRRSCTR